MLLGCGPIRSGGLLIDASGELSAAQTGQAPKWAPYEYWAAKSYLHKAREDYSYAHYETAELFAGKAMSCARLARAIAEKYVRKDMGVREFAIPKRLSCPVGSQKLRYRRALEHDQLHNQSHDDSLEPQDPHPSDMKPLAQPKQESPRIAEEPLPPGDDD